MGPSGPYGTLKKSTFKNWPKIAKITKNFNFKVGPLPYTLTNLDKTWYVGTYGCSLSPCRKISSWLKPNFDFWTPSWAPRLKKADFWVFSVLSRQGTFMKNFFGWSILFTLIISFI